MINGVADSEDGDNLSPEETQLRARAVRLLQAQWSGLVPQVRGWLRLRPGEDADLVDEVFVRLLVRFKRGAGMVAILRADPNRDEDKLLQSQAWWMCKEVRKPRRGPIVDPVAPGTGSLAGDGADPAPDERDWSGPAQAAADRFAAGPAPAPHNAYELAAHINALLVRGEEAWETLCDDGAIDRADWSAHQKWTAIGMLWGFSAPHIAVIRYVKVQSDPRLLEKPHSTTEMMSKVREKGAKLLAAKSRSFRIEHDLPLEDPADPDDPDDPDEGEEADEREQ